MDILLSGDAPHGGSRTVFDAGRRSMTAAAFRTCLDPKHA